MGESQKDLLDEDKRRLTYLVEINFEGKTYKISQDMWDAMCSAATEREMTIDEYIAEAFTMLKEQEEGGWAANGSPVED